MARMTVVMSHDISHFLLFIVPCMHVIFTSCTVFHLDHMSVTYYWTTGWTDDKGNTSVTLLFNYWNQAITAVIIFLKDSGFHSFYDYDAIWTMHCFGFLNFMLKSDIPPRANMMLTRVRTLSNIGLVKRWRWSGLHIPQTHLVLEKVNGSWDWNPRKIYSLAGEIWMWPVYHAKVTYPM